MEAEHRRAHGQPAGIQYKDIDQYSIHSLSSRPTHITNAKHREKQLNPAQIRQGSFNNKTTQAGSRLQKDHPSSTFSVNSDKHHQYSGSGAIAFNAKLGMTSGQVQSMAGGMISRPRSKGVQFHMTGK